MATLSARDKNRLLSYAGFKAYVENPDNRSRYKAFVEQWRANNSDDERLVDPDFIAENLKIYLLYYDTVLPELMRTTLQSSFDADHMGYYLNIAQYFVDFTDGLIH